MKREKTVCDLSAAMKAASWFGDQGSEIFTQDAIRIAAEAQAKALRPFHDLARDIATIGEQPGCATSALIRLRRLRAKADKLLSQTGPIG